MTNDENTDWFKKGKDIAKAKELFQKAGYDGKPVVVLQATDHYLANPAGLFAAQWLRQAGINVDLAAMDWGALLTRRAVKKPPAEGGWNMFSTTVTGITFSDPIAFTGQAAAGEKSWFGWPSDPLQEQLRKKWATAPTLAARKGGRERPAAQRLGLHPARHPRPVLPQFGLAHERAWRARHARGGGVLEYGEGGFRLTVQRRAILGGVSLPLAGRG